MSDPNPVNKIKYGLKKVYVAVQTETAGAYTYGTPTALPGAVSLSLDAQGEDTPFYADDCVYYRSNNNNGYSGTLELAYITDWFRINILGEDKDAKDVLFEKADGADKIYFAMMFEFDGDQHQVRHVMYNCSVSRPAVASSTKENSITPITETLNITCDPRLDGLVKGKTTADTDSTVYNGWYSNVYTPTAAAGTP